MEDKKRRKTHQNKRSLLMRLLSSCLCGVLIFTYSGTGIFAMVGDSQGTSNEQTTALATPPDGVEIEEVTQDEAMSALTFPDTVEEGTPVATNPASNDEVSPKEVQDEPDLGETQEAEPPTSTQATAEGERALAPVPPKNVVGEMDKASAKTAFDQSAVVDGVKISVKADDGVFQDAKALKVRKVSNSEAEKVKEAVEDKREGDRKVAVSYTFDISVLDHEGNEVQPDTTKGEVSVSFQMEEAKNQNLSADVYHVDETSQAEKLETEVKGEEVSAKTDGFSFYTVEFTYGNMQYVLAGDSTIDLSEILAKVGLSGEVTAVSVSNSALFSAEKTADNRWMITAHRAFDTKEWMKVTIKDVIYEIAVTDSQHPLTVTGGIENVDYKWENYSYNENLGDHSAYKLKITKKYILHILSSEALLIEGDATKFNEGDGGAIVIPESVKANITLKNTKIFPMVNIPPMVVMKNAECKLTLEGENTLTPRLLHVTAGAGAFDKVPAIWVPEGAKLTVTQASTGTLKADSAYQNAVIGGWRYGHARTIIIDGGTLKLNNDGYINSITNISGPCIGGHRKFELIEINGGKIEATCVQSAPIGMSYEPIVDVDAKGEVIVNGGTIVTRHQNRSGVNPYYADGIGDTQHHTAVDVRINGGNVNTDFDRTRPNHGYILGYDGSYRVKITLLGAGEGQEITSYTLLDGTTINLKDAKTLPNGELYLWLVEDKIVTSVRCGGQDYTGVVKAVHNDTDAQAVFRTGTTGTGTLTASLKAEHVQGVKLNHTTGLSAGDTVALSFDGAESGYLLKGMCLYTGTTPPPAPREVSSDFTKITDKLYSFTMPAENVTVYLNAPKIRTVRAGEQTHIASVSFNPTANLTVGDTVKLAYAPEAGWKVTGMALRKATDTPANPQDISSDFTKLSDGSYQFTMPDDDVCIDFKCEEEAVSGVEVGDFLIIDPTCNYSFDTNAHRLDLSGSGRIIVTMKNGVTSTSDHIFVRGGSNIILTIKDLNVVNPDGAGLNFTNNIGNCQLVLKGNNKFTNNKAWLPAIKKESAGKLTILGDGKLTAISSGLESTGIGSEFCDNLYIEGGTISAKGSQEMGIGGGSPREKNIHYKGGTVEGVGDGYDGITGEYINVIIQGGSIHSVNNGTDVSRHRHPTNGSTRVYLTTITLGEGATLAKQAYVTALTGAGNYGINQMHTDDEGKLYLWLPNGTTVTKVETDKGIYQGSVTTNTANYFGTANAVFTLAEKQEGSGSVAIEGWTYGESAKAPVPTSTTNGTANVSYTYFTNEACTTKTTRDNSGADSIGSVPKNVGSYWVQATFAETPRYKAVIAKAGFAIKKATVSFTPPTAKTGLTYTGETQALINAGTVDTGIGKLTYSLSETGTYSETIPRAQDAGTYHVYYKVVGTNANYDYTNAKGDIEVSIGKIAVPFTPPTAKTGLAYTGEAQALINVGTVDATIGKLTYSLSEAGTYSQTIPSAQDAGTYIVYYQVIGTNSNYDYSSTKGSVAVTIAKAGLTPTVALADWIYNTSPNAPTITGNTGGGAVTYDYFTDEACTSKTTVANDGADSEGGVPKNVGTYWVKASVAESTNYTAATAKATFAIKKAEVPFTPPTAKTGLAYTGEAQALINAGTVDASIGKLVYSLSEAGTYSETLPSAQEASTHTVYYRVEGTNANYEYTNAKGSVAVTIAKVALTPTVALADWTYGTSPNAPTLTGNTGGGAVSYAYFTNEACTIKTKAINSLSNSEGGVPKNAGQYWVKASIAETANYQGATAKVAFEINKANQMALAIGEVIGKKFGDGAFTLTTTGGSGNGAVSYTAPVANGVLEIHGNQAKIIGAGTVTLTANKAGDNNYNETSAERTLTIAKGNTPPIAFPTASELTYGQALSESTLTGGSAEYGTFAWKDGTIIPTINNTGYEVVFTPNAATVKNYTIVPITKKVLLKVNKQPQASLTISAIPPKIYGDEAFKLRATGGSGDGMISYSVPEANGVLEIDGDRAKIIGAGRVSLTAKKAEDATYREMSTSISLTVAKKKLTVSAEDKTINKGEAMPTFTSQVEGLVNGDSFDNPVFTPSAIDTNTVGDYEIVVSGGTLKTTDGKEAKDNYDITYQKGKLVIKETYKVEVVEGTGSGKYSEGQTVSLKANHKSGYSFTKWTSDDGVVFDKPTDKETTFIMPAKAVTVKANYSESSPSSPEDGGGGYGGQTPINTPNLDKAPDKTLTAELTIQAGVDENGVASAEVPEKDLVATTRATEEAAKKSGNHNKPIAVEVGVTLPQKANAFTLTLSEETLNRLVSERAHQLEVKTPLVRIVFDKNALASLKTQSNGKLKISVMPKANVTGKAKTLVGQRPLYDIKLSYDSGKAVTNLDKGTAKVSIPYRLAQNEVSGGLYAVYVDSKGKVNKIDQSLYDSKSGAVTFSTNHFSLYGVGYSAPVEGFSDIKNHWAKDAINYVTGKGLMTGKGDKFLPNAPMTREMLVMALGRHAGIEENAYQSNSFSDVSMDGQGRPYIEWAYKNGVIYGVGNGKFAPERAITREEIAVIFARYAQYTGYRLPILKGAKTYADSKTIGSAYQMAVTAMQEAEIMTGDTAGQFSPKGKATRAEVASMLMRYIKLTNTPKTAQGWTVNDSGKSLYYKEGLALTGKQIIDEVVYFFDEKGNLQTGWQKDGSHWRYYKGNKPSKGWLKLKLGEEEKTYYLNQDGLLEANKWLQIEDKWYYFYPDGSLAVNTTIDGHKVDRTGARIAY